MRPAPALMTVLVAASALLGACGTSSSDQVKSKVEQFARAVEAKDYRTLCEDVLAPSLLQRLSATGVSCEQAMEVALGGVQNPTLSIGRITVHGHTATAITLTGASGQQASLDAVELIETKAGWRVSSLGSPVSGH